MDIIPLLDELQALARTGLHFANNVPQAMGVVALLLLVLLSFGFVMVRRQSAQS